MSSELKIGMNEKDILINAIEKLSCKDSLKGLSYQYDNEAQAVPSGVVLNEIISLGRAILFPGFYGCSTMNGDTVKFHIGVNIERLHHLVEGQTAAALWVEAAMSGNDITMEEIAKLAKEKSNAFIDRLPEIRRILATDVSAAFDGDPAAENYGEIILCYPSTKALANYRMAHELLKLGVPLMPRMMTELAHSETGIDIHPGAQIGEHFSIDHGTGVVIGATCIIGNNVKLYQGVTLGAKSFPLDENGDPVKGVPRHPIIGDNVIIYANATVLGRITIGHDSIIGGNIWVTEDVEPHSHIVQFRQKR